MSKTKIKQILNNMLEDFESKWCSHEERNNGIDKVAEKILEEVPDREEEMRELLEESISKAKVNISYCIENNMSNTAHSWEGRLLAYKEILQLLTKKTENYGRI